jgi:hypothetical protein
MWRTLPPILFHPTLELRGVLGTHARAAAACAFREIALAAKGLEIEHLQFEFQGFTVAVYSRVRGDGRLVIEAGVGNPNLPRRCITADHARQVAQRVASTQRPGRGEGHWSSNHRRRVLG